MLIISILLCQYCRYEPVLADDGTTPDFTADKADTNLFKIKQKNRSNRQQCHKKCENNGTIKIPK